MSQNILFSHKFFRNVEKHLLLQLSAAGFGGSQLLLQTLHGAVGVMGLHAEPLGDGAVLVIHGGENFCTLRTFTKPT